MNEEITKDELVERYMKVIERNIELERLENEKKELERKIRQLNIEKQKDMKIVEAIEDYKNRK